MSHRLTTGLTLLFKSQMNMKLGSHEAWNAKLTLTFEKWVQMHKEILINEDVFMWNHILCAKEHDNH